MSLVLVKITWLCHEMSALSREGIDALVFMVTDGEAGRGSPSFTRVVTSWLRAAVQSITPRVALVLVEAQFRRATG